MERFKSADELLDFAISKEAEAAQLYETLAGRMASSAMQKVFKDFAREELRHKAKLEKIKEGKIGLPSPRQVTDLKLAEMVQEPDVRSDLTYQEALVLAMKREKGAFKLYSDLAEMVSDEEIRKTLLALAQEEAKHKLRFELEYDEEFLTEN